MKLRLDEKVPKSKYATLIEKIAYLFFTILTIVLLFEYIRLLVSISDLSTYRPTGIALIFERFGGARILSISTIILIIIVVITTILITYFNLLENPDFFSIGHRKMIFIRNKILAMIIISVMILLMYLNALHWIKERVKD